MTIKCRECQKEFERITVKHLRTHNMEKEDYLEKYPKSEFTSEEYKNKLSNGVENYYEENEHHMKGQTPDKDWREKISKSLKETYKEQPELAEKSSKRMKENNPTEGKTMSDNPFWKNSEHYRGPTWKYQRQKALERDNKKCRKCRSEPTDKIYVKLSVHHIIPIENKNLEKEDEYKNLNQLKNLVTLCASCHHKIESNWSQDKQMDYFNQYPQIQLNSSTSTT